MLDHIDNGLQNLKYICEDNLFQHLEKNHWSEPNTIEHLNLEVRQGEHNVLHWLPWVNHNHVQQEQQI